MSDDFVTYVYESSTRPKKGSAQHLFPAVHGMEGRKFAHGPIGKVIRIEEGADHHGLDVHVQFNRRSVETWLKAHPEYEIGER